MREVVEATVDHAGSVADAAHVMPDIEALERGDASPPADGPDNTNVERDEQGRFKAKETEAPDGEDADKAADSDAGKKASEAEADPQEQDDEDYFEIPSEDEGGEPQRFKASEVFEGFKRSHELETELANVKKVTPPPPDYEAALQETVQARGKYLEALQMFPHLLQLQKPDRDLVNPASEKYNPEEYAAQEQMFLENSQRISAAKQLYDQQFLAQRQEHATLERARATKERAALEEFWPEIKEEGFAATVQSDLERHYGIDADTLNTVLDSRFYRIAKDALAFRKAEAATKQAVKVVKAKPKLVKGQQRTDQKAARRSDGMARLEKSGSIDDAYDALDGLL